MPIEEVEVKYTVDPSVDDATVSKSTEKFLRSLFTELVLRDRYTSVINTEFQSLNNDYSIKNIQETFGVSTMEEFQTMLSPEETYLPTKNFIDSLDPYKKALAYIENTPWANQEIQRIYNMDLSEFQTSIVRIEAAREANNLPVDKAPVIPVAKVTEYHKAQDKLYSDLKKTSMKDSCKNGFVKFLKNVVKKKKLKKARRKQNGGIIKKAITHFTGGKNR